MIAVDVVFGGWIACLMVPEEVGMKLNLNGKKKNLFVVVELWTNLPFPVPVAAWSAFDIRSKPVAGVVEW